MSDKKVNAVQISRKYRPNKLYDQEQIGQRKIIRILLTKNDTLHR